MNERYARQLLLDEIGETGQAKLAAGRVLLIGAGGLGSPAALYLAAAGMGTIALADSDVVELSNLNRQIAHSTSRINTPKVDSAAGMLRDLNPEVQVITHHMRVTQENIAALIADYDFVLDCSDNFATKFLINDACVASQKPFCHAGVMGFSSQLMTWLPGCTCFRCIFRQPPSGPQNKAVLGVAAGLAGTLQAMEAIKFITGTGELLTNTLLTIDALTGEFHRVALPRNASCVACEKEIL